MIKEQWPPAEASKQKELFCHYLSKVFPDQLTSLEEEKILEGTIIAILFESGKVFCLQRSTFLCLPAESRYFHFLRDSSIGISQSKILKTLNLNNQ
jgi:hypothetical protein